MNRLRVVTVADDGAAKRAGIEKDDVLDTIGGVPLESTDILIQTLGGRGGQSCELVAYRKGRRIRVQVDADSLGVTLSPYDTDQNHEEWVVLQRAHDLIVSTAPSIDGFRVSETIDIVTAEYVLGMNAFRDLLAAVTDFVGGVSGTTQNALREARQRCIHDLRVEAARLAADGVIGVALSYSEFSGGGKSMIFLVVSGTAVKLSKL